MGALTASRNTPMQDAICFPTRLDLPVEASTKCFGGGMAALNAAGFVVPASVNLALKVIGRFEKDVDNSAGAQGAVTAAIRCGVFRYANSSAGDAITVANRFSACYVVDDNTVALTSGVGTRPSAGQIFDVDSAGVWVLQELFIPASLGLVDLGNPGLTPPVGAGTALGDSSPTITVSQGRWRVLPSVPLTAGRTITLGTTAAVGGDMIEITRLDVAAFTVAVANGGPGAGTLLTMPASKVNFGSFQFDGTNWALRRCGVQ